LANLFLKKGDYEKAFVYLRKTAESIEAQHEFSYDLIDIYSCLAELSLKMNDFRQASKMYIKAFNYLKQHRSKDIENGLVLADRICEISILLGEIENSMKYGIECLDMTSETYGNKSKEQINCAKKIAQMSLKVRDFR
jgi:tetratricopeptide (TPR) repeat protein